MSTWNTTTLFNSILSLEVAQTKVTQLLKLLDERFNRYIATSIQNSQTVILV